MGMSIIVNMCMSMIFPKTSFFFFFFQLILSFFSKAKNTEVSINFHVPKPPIPPLFKLAVPPVPGDALERAGNTWHHAL